MINVTCATPLDPIEIPLAGCKAAEKMQILNSAPIVDEIPLMKLQNFESLVLLLYAPEVDDSSATKQPSLNSYKLLAHISEAYTNGALFKALEKRQYAPAYGKIETYDVNSSTMSTITVIGLGLKSELKPEKAKTIAKCIATLITQKRPTSLQIIPPSEMLDENYLKATLVDLLILLSPHVSYSPIKQTEEYKKALQLPVISIAGLVSSNLIEKAKAYAKGVYLAQELVNAPPNYCNPDSLANVGLQIAAKYGMTFILHDKNELIKRQMGGIVAVGQGSKYSPKLVHITYKSGVAKHKIMLVGKAITFDSGGLNIKSMQSLIDKMKIDMGGAASVLGAAHIIGEMKPENCEVHFLYAPAENAVSDNAYRPGDIITTYDGTTIEITNTDAEGRMTLCDVLGYAQKDCHADYIVDVATLTGAQMIAFGNLIGGLFCNDNEVANALLSSAESEGELLARMPLHEIYNDTLKSSIADLRNHHMDTGAGAMVAALFLKKFIKKDVKWAHLDIAGPAFDWKELMGTGYGARLLTNFVLSMI